MFDGVAALNWHFCRLSLMLADDIQQTFNKINNGKLTSPSAVPSSRNTYLDQFLKIRAGLRMEFSKWYKVALNGSPAWQGYAERDGKPHPLFAMAGEESLEAAFDAFDQRFSQPVQNS